ncbi:MAG: serine hydrolase [Bryobacterales bacterium]|nr:serine hydrolase [Bryobacterales bacterium]
MRSLILLAMIAAGPALPQKLYFPGSGDWERVQPQQAGWSADGLDALLRFAESRRSTGVVILVGGRILTEQHWDPKRFEATAQYRFEKTADGQILEDVASMQKSVTAMLFGIARAKKLVDFDTPVSKALGAGWSKLSAEQEGAITMRHLLTMTSGTSDELGFEAAPATKWRYNSVAYQKILPALARVAGKDANTLTREWLTGPIGMRHGEWRERPNMRGMVGFVTAARDMARFGLMVLAGGVWNGKRIVDAEFVEEALRPSQKLNPSYGLLWWLNGQPVRRAGARGGEMLIPTAPKDAVAAQGALGRKVYVAKSLGLVAVRIGGEAQRKGEADFNTEFWRLLMAAAPKGVSR